MHQCCWLLVGVLLLALAPASWAETSATGQGESVCLQCHEAQPGRLGEPVPLWRTSVHAANGITCHSCHGGDPTDFAQAMSPERGFLGVPKEQAIPDFCGRCHVGVRDDYLDSAHGRALGKGGPQCVTCHGNHAVQKASLALINPTDCTRCHDYGRAEEIRGAMQLLDERILQQEGRVERLHRIGIATAPFKAELFALRNEFHRLFHTVEVAKVRRETSRFNHTLDGIETRLAAIDATLVERRQLGGVVAGLLLLAGILFMLVRKSYRDEERNRDGE